MDGRSIFGFRFFRLPPRKGHLIRFQIQLPVSLGLAAPEGQHGQRLALHQAPMPGQGEMHLGLAVLKSVILGIPAIIGQVTVFRTFFRAVVVGTGADGGGQHRKGGFLELVQGLLGL